MGKGRLEAFSAGVIAIIIVITITITIMVLLELKVPHGDSIDILWPLMPVLLSYVLSFIYVGIYWNKLQYANYPSAESKSWFRRLLLAPTASMMSRRRTAV